MLIAIVEFKVSANDRPAAVEALLSETETVRAMDGCRAFRPFADPENPETCGILHEWDSEAEFTVYATSPGFAAIGEILRPLMIAPPISRRFNAKLIETVG